MTKVSKMIKKAAEVDVIVDAALDEERLSGVYGFFYLDLEKNTEYCFYIGKAISIYDRIFGCSNGHIFFFLNSLQGKYVKPKEEKIIEDINYYRNKKGKVELRLLEKVNMEEELYERAAHKLAFAEYSLIEKYQRKGQCLHQLPEGAESSRKYWENNLKKVTVK